MVSSYIVVVGAFVLYYLLVLFLEKKMINEPKDIIAKFLSVVLLYAGISIIYYALSGQPFLNESEETYKLYIFIIGFIAIIWTIPDLLSEFNFFRRFIRKSKKKK